MRSPERRRRVLFLGQTGVGVVGVLVPVALVLLGVQTSAGTSALLGVLLAVAVAAIAWWALLSLERAKFVAVAAPPVDWARELREVRDSRRVIVSAFEIERRRIERDLHDGAQQYLVSATMRLGEASLLLEQHAAGSPGELTPLAPLLEGARTVMPRRRCAPCVPPYPASIPKCSPTWDCSPRSLTWPSAAGSASACAARTDCRICPRRWPPWRGSSARRR